jgi:2-hydroxy-6-oxonona-2,4-dienedioate hydrolase
MIPQTGKLQTTWTSIGNLRMHAHVSVDPVPAESLPVVLVHGIGVASCFMVPTAELLAPRYQVYAPDLPGFGKSDKPSRVLNVDELTDSLAAWMRETGLERAALPGNSFGCQIVAQLALNHPELIQRAVLQGPTMDPRARTAPRQIVRWLRNSRREHPSQALITVQEYRSCGIRRLTKTFRYALQDPIEKKLPRVHVPTLVVRGSRDPIVPQRWAEEATRLLPMGRLVVIPDAPHTIIYNCPSELVRVVRPFLDEDRRAPAERST